MQQYPYSTISQPNLQPNLLRQALKELPPDGEESTFWTRIANDTRYPIYQRRSCIIALFRRHVHVGMTLARIGQILDRPVWLEDQNLHVFKEVLGKIPIKITPDDTVVSIVVLPEADQKTSAVYLRIQGHVTKEALLKFLQTGSGEQAICYRILQEIGTDNSANK